MPGLNNNNNPLQSQVRYGPGYIQLVPGPPGPAGPPGGTVFTTANFVQPNIGSSVSVAVTSTAGMAADLDLFIQGGGYYQVVSVSDSTDVVVQNLGTSGINVNPGLTVTNGAVVQGSGPPLQVSPAHSVMVGEGSAAVVGVGPGAAGLPLVAQGASSDPTFAVLGWTGGGRLQGIVHVVNGTPGTLDATHQIALCESNTGTTSVAIPTAADFGGTIPDGWPFQVSDTGGAAATSNITVTNATALAIVDPNTLVKVTGSITLAANYASVTWQWDATELAFTPTSGSSLATTQTNGASSGGTLVLTPASPTWNLVVAGDVVTMPQPMVVGRVYEFMHDQIRSPQPSPALLEDNPVTFHRGSGATYNFLNPQDGTQAAASTATWLGPSGTTLRLRLDSAGVIRFG